MGSFLQVYRKNLSQAAVPSRSNMSFILIATVHMTCGKRVKLENISELLNSLLDGP